MKESVIVVYTSRRWREALGAFRDHAGPVIATTSDLAKLLRLKWTLPEKQRGLFNDL